MPIANPFPLFYTLQEFTSNNRIRFDSAYLNCSLSILATSSAHRGGDVHIKILKYYNIMPHHHCGTGAAAIPHHFNTVQPHSNYSYHHHMLSHVSISARSAVWFRQWAWYVSTIFIISTISHPRCRVVVQPHLPIALEDSTQNVVVALLLSSLSDRI